MNAGHSGPLHRNQWDLPKFVPQKEKGCGALYGPSARTVSEHYILGWEGHAKSMVVKERPRLVLVGWWKFYIHFLLRLDNSLSSLTCL